MAISHQLRADIADDLKAGATIREVMELRNVSKDTVTRVRNGIKHLLGSKAGQKQDKKQDNAKTAKTGQKKPSKSRTTDSKPGQETSDFSPDIVLVPPRDGMVPGKNGGWINGGPGLGKPKGSVSKLRAMVDFLATERKEGGTWGDAVMESLCNQAMAGNKDMMSMLLTAVQKADEREREVEAIVSDTLNDPLFNNMSLAELEAEIFVSLKTKYEAADIQEEA